MNSQIHPMTPEVFPDLAALLEAAAERFVQTIADVPHPAVVLTGGGAGIGLLRLLADDRYARRIAWDTLHVFFGDERAVPVNHPDSNEGQARAALLSHVPIPEENIHGYDLSGSLEDAAAAYAAELAGHDLVLHLLGMGAEGHVNSLFPHTPGLASEDMTIAVHDSPKPPAHRVSLTLRAINSAQHVWLLVAGAEKAEAARAAVRRADPAQWPAAGACGQHDTVIFLTADAAGLMES